jgi:hypothetical protein
LIGAKPRCDPNSSGRSGQSSRSRAPARDLAMFNLVMRARGPHQLPIMSGLVSILQSFAAAKIAYTCEIVRSTAIFEFFNTIVQKWTSEKF